MFYKKRISKPDTPQQVAERKLNQVASALALDDMRKKYPTLTTENFQEADDYRKQRIRELEK